jgi:hypothetical protein
VRGVAANGVDVKDKGYPGQWHLRTGLPADERLVSLGRSGPGVGNGFLETPRIRFGGVFLASAQTAAQSAVPGASTPRV